MLTMNSDLTVVQRSGYTILDVLSDIGGFLGFLTASINFLLSILNYQHLDNYLVTRLFTAKAGSSLAQFEFHSWDNLKYFCIDNILPAKLVCCSKTRKEEAIQKARATLEKEKDVVKLIKFRRFVKLALEQLLQPQVFREIKSKSRTTVVEVLDQTFVQNESVDISRQQNVSISANDLTMSVIND